jgi:hypothetical protein
MRQLVRGVRSAVQGPTDGLRAGLVDSGVDGRQGCAGGLVVQKGGSDGYSTVGSRHGMIWWQRNYFLTNEGSRCPRCDCPSLTPTMRAHSEQPSP